MSEAAAQRSATAGGRPGDRKRWTSKILPVYTGLVLFYLMLPIFVMILFGFNATKGRFNFTWQGFTLEWYRDLFAVPDLTDALVNSLGVAVVATLLSTIMGTMIALSLGRHKFRGEGGVNLVLFMSIASPEVALGAALLALFVTVGVERGLVTIVIAHIMFCIAFVTITVRARLAGFDNRLEEAAQDLGARPWTAFWKVTFPLIFPGILSAALLAFALSIDDYIITSFVAGQTLTFPLWVFGASRLGIPPQVNVMGTLIFTVGAAFAVTGLLQAQRASRAAKREAADTRLALAEEGRTAPAQ